MALQKETDLSAWRETSYYVMTTERAWPGQEVRWTPDPLWAAECAGDHGADDELVDSRTVHLVTFGVTRRTADGCVLNPISTDQLTCRSRKSQGRCGLSGSLNLIDQSWLMKREIQMDIFFSIITSVRQKQTTRAYFILTPLLAFISNINTLNN